MFGEVEFTSMDTYKQVSEVNLWGTIRLTKAVLPLIRRAKGQQRENHCLLHIITLTYEYVTQPCQTLNTGHVDTKLVFFEVSL